MSDMIPIHNLGVPITVDVATIETQLSKLWETASPAGESNALVRACSCNLVVIAEGRAEAAALLGVLAAVAEYHPSRSIITFGEPNGELPGDTLSAPIKAWISAQCSLPYPGRPQVCSEVITLAAREEAMAGLPNTVSSLLVPDLPVFIYWRSFRGKQQSLVENMVKFARLLIVDSHASKEDPYGRERLLELLNRRPGGIAVRDLNWARLTAWRDLISQFFDHPSLRPLAYQISEVEINRDIEYPGNIPTRTLLLTGWLATQLNWRRVTAEKRGTDWISRWQSPSGEVLVRFSGQQALPGHLRGISSVELRTREGGTFKAARSRGSDCITATASAEGITLSHVAPQDTHEEAILLTRELSLPGEDCNFEVALAEAIALEKSFN
jgi:glucose-6-phosphate dehydrogenase assembly protein OpcA